MSQQVSKASAQVSGTSSNSMSLFIWILYIIFTFFLFVASCCSLAWLTKSRNHSHDPFITIYPYDGCWGWEPLNIKYGMLVFFNVLLMLIALWEFIAMFLKGNVIKDDFFSVLFTKWGLVNFAFIAFNVVLYLLTPGNDGDWSKWDDIKITGLVFTILALIAGGLVYFLTHFKDDIFGFLWKKCYVSGFLVINLFYFFYVIEELYHDKHQNSGKKKQGDTNKALSIVFQILFGIISFLILFFFTDLVFGGFAAFVYMGILAGNGKKLCRIDPWSNKGKEYVGDLILSIILMIVFLVLTVIIGIVKKGEILKT